MTLTQIEAFAITLAVEAPVAALLAPLLGAKRGRAALSAVVGSAVTHPILWMVYYPLHASLGAATAPMLEALVVLAEAPAYRFVGAARWSAAFALSLAANAASWLTGEIIYALT